MIDVKHFRAFITTAEVLNVSRAAELLKVQPSTLSRQITALEDKLGVSLFERRRSGMQLTTAGAGFLSGVLRTLYEFDRAVTFAGRSGLGQAGQITLGFFLSLSAGRQRELVSGFASRSEGVEIDLVEGGREDLLTRLRERQLDLVFVPGEIETLGLERMPGWTERFVAAVPEDHPLAGKDTIGWSDLAREMIIVRAFEGATEIRAFLLTKLAGAPGPLRLRQHDVSRESLLNLVGIGQGIAIVTDSCCGAEYPGVVFRPIAGEDAQIPISLVWIQENANPVLQRFRSFARERLKTRTPQSAD